MMRVNEDVSWIVGAGLFVLGALVSAPGCSGPDEPEDRNTRTGSPCGAGELLELSTQQVCVYQQEIVIETGFSCPAAYPNRQDLGSGATVCSQDVDGLDMDEVMEVEGQLEELGWMIEDPPTNETSVVNNNNMTSSNNTTTPNNNTTSNNTTVNSTSPPADPNRLDLLWVVDNSFSMCQEQAALRENFELLAQQIERLDFQIAITTTHAPFSPFSIEPIAQRGLIQSTPQPVPGNNALCIRGDGVIDGEQTQFLPLRQSLQAALGCLADPAEAANYEWTDAEIECALRGDMTCDYNSDGSAGISDLFPDYADYRAIPKVLRAQDYRDGSGALDLASLEADFACASLVGTRGDGYEKGLLASVEAVSPTNTGGAVGGPSVDTSAPNHGLIRQDARFGVIFVSDENDCSHDGSLDEQAGACGPNACEYYNSTEVPPSESPLLTAPELAARLRANLEQTTGRTYREGEIFAGGIYGTWERLNQPLPQCALDESLEVSASCSSSLGNVYSGDRYERFVRQFVSHYPNTVVEEHGAQARLDFSKTEPVGLMCSNDFGPALQSMGQELAP